jgi:hypothetical protein
MPPATHSASTLRGAVLPRSQGRVQQQGVGTEIAENHDVVPVKLTASGGNSVAARWPGMGERDAGLVHGLLQIADARLIDRTREKVPPFEMGAVRYP